MHFSSIPYPIQYFQLFGPNSRKLELPLTGTFFDFLQGSS